MKIALHISQYTMQENEQKKHIEKIGSLIRDIIQKLRLDITTLEEFICTDHMHDQVLEFQKSRGLQEQISDNCVGKTIFYIDNNQLRSTIFFRFDISLGLHIDNPLSLNLLIHELAHVHEGYNTSSIYDIEIFSFDNYIERRKLLNYNLKRLANITWEEYFAVRVASCISAYNISYVEQLINEINDNIQEIDHEFYKYIILNRSNIDYFFARLNEFTNIIFIRFAYIGADINYQVNDIYEDEIKKYSFYAIFRQVIDELYRLTEKYPQWTGIEEYESLANITLEFWRTLGINVLDDGDHLTINRYDS